MKRKNLAQPALKFALRLVLTAACGGSLCQCQSTRRGAGSATEEDEAGLVESSEDDGKKKDRALFRVTVDGEEPYTVETGWNEEYPATDDAYYPDEVPFEEVIAGPDEPLGTGALDVGGGFLPETGEIGMPPPVAPSIPGFERAEWMRNPREARALALKENKHLLFFFLADWVPNSERMRRELNSSREFHEFASERLVVTYLDFPRSFGDDGKRQAAYERFRDHFEISGYPSVLLIDPAGNVVKKITGYSHRWTAKRFAYELGELMDRE